MLLLQSLHSSLYNQDAESGVGGHWVWELRTVSIVTLRCDSPLTLILSERKWTFPKVHDLHADGMQKQTVESEKM